MKRIVLSVTSALLLCVSVLSAAYTYTVVENLYTPNWANWTVTGTLTPAWYAAGGYGGLGDGSSGTMMSNATPTEVKVKVRGTSNSFTIKLDDGVTNGYFDGHNFIFTNVETNYYVQIYNNGTTFSLLKNYIQTATIPYGPQTQLLAYMSIPFGDNTTIRAVARPWGSGATAILVYVNNNLVIWYLDSPGLTTGNAGLVIGGSGSGANLLTEADLGPLDSVGPNPVPLANISTAAYTNHVDLSWTATTDDTNGIGLYGYQVYRNGAFLTTTTGLSFSDTTVVPSTTYSYTLYAVDYHWNFGATTFNVTTPHIPTNPPYPSVTPDGQRTGVRPTGAYWGGGGENIDVLSGNLNFTLPLLKAMSRGGGGVPFNLAYNSQNWRQDSGGAWNFGYDVGYGYGWRLLAGSITPVWNPGGFTAAYYLFSDATGAEYRLDQNGGNIWSSLASVYVWFDANTNVLHFRDGTYWNFNCISAGTEQDSGVMHPTLIEDSNGNQILIRYQTAPGAGWPNSSARITQIEDVRATIRGGGVYATYDFTYNADPIPHLTSIANSIGTGEAYTFSYTGGQALASPINSQSFGTTTWLSSASVTTLNATHVFTYDSGGELTKVVLPYGGYIAWLYGTTGYLSNTLSYREVTTRYLSPDGTVASQIGWPFGHESTTPTGYIHQWTQINDPSAATKFWVFGQSGPSLGLVTTYLGTSFTAFITQNDLTWNLDPAGNSYIGTNLTTLDSGQTYSVQQKTTQTVDTYGNVTQVNTFDYGNLTTPIRTYNYTYTGYAPQYIFNRLSQASMTDGTNTTTLVTNYYDNYASACAYGGGVYAVSGLREWDGGYTTSFLSRGNPICSITPSGMKTMAYDQAGNLVIMTVNGVQTQVSTSSTNNFAAPTQLTTGSLTSTMGWSSFLGLTNETGPNGDSASTTYDAYARPSGSTSPFGAPTTVTFSNFTNPPTTGQWVKSTTNGRWTKKTVDGLGHAILVETGDASTTKSQAESVYGPCGCSPMLKLKQQAMPHAVGAGAVYTTYTYDAIGRTISTLAPDGASTSTYSYQGNTVTATDPAGKWKKFTMNGLGNLTQVLEPDPANPTTATYTTTYAYDLWNNLKTVTMPRPTGTQTRTFTYNGSQLLSATNPENGTVSYTYNSTNSKIATKTDAKGQVVKYMYDTYARLTQVQRYPTGLSNPEDTCQQENYYYDTNTFVPGYSTYSSGRLVAVQYYGPLGSYANPSPYANSSGSCGTTYTEMYMYSQAGAKLGKKLRITRTLSTGPPSPPAMMNIDLDSTYTYDNEGRMTAMQYPNSGTSSSPITGPHLGNGFDSMGRLNALTDIAASTGIIGSVTYGPSNELLSMGGAVNETRTYNSMLQMTHLTTNGVNISYVYSATQNNGKITSQTDNVSGEQVVYAYDALNRLASAAATSSVWGQSYNYDGFGNLTDQNVTAGSAPAYHVVMDPTTNRTTGSCSDANGNDGACLGGSKVYDVENRFTGSGGPGFGSGYQYAYAPGNKRVWKGTCCGVDPVTGNPIPLEEATFWGVSGQKLAAYQIVSYSGQTVPMTIAPQFYATQTATNYYFGGKLIKNASGYVGADRLGSIGKYYPYGQEKPSATTNGTEKFTGYFRDSETGLDYADQRFHSPGTGRFLTPDPKMSSASLRNPITWNRYSYVLGDPVNFFDPSGLDVCIPVAIGGFGGAPVCFADPQSVTVTAPMQYLPVYVALPSYGCNDIWCNTANQLAGLANLQLDLGNLPCPAGEVRYPYGCDIPIDPTGQKVWALINKGGAPAFVNMLGAVTAVVTLGLTGGEFYAWAAVGEAGNAILLGRAADGYVELGGALGADTFSIPDAVWQTMTADQQWTANQAFLDAAIQRGASILLGSNPANAPVGSFFWREVQYLISQGYEVAADGVTMIRP